MGGAWTWIHPDPGSMLLHRIWATPPPLSRVFPSCTLAALLWHYRGALRLTQPPQPTTSNRLTPPLSPPSLHHSTITYLECCSTRQRHVQTLGPLTALVPRLPSNLGMWRAAGPQNPGPQGSCRHATPGPQVSRRHATPGPQGSRRHATPGP